MKPIAYEIRRTLTSKFVILMIVAIIGLSSLLAYELAASYNSSPLTSRTPAVSVGYYVSSGELTVVAYAYNSFGAPYSGLSINVSYNNVMHSGETNAAGFANFTYTYVTSSHNTLYQVVSYNYSYSLFGLRQHTPSSQVPVYSGIDYSGFSIIRGIVSTSNSSNIGFQLLYIGPNGAAAPDTGIYIAPFPKGSSSATSQYVYDNHTYSYNYSGFTVKTIFPALTNSNYNKTYAMTLTDSSGSFVATFPTENPTNGILLGKLSTYTPMTQSTLQSLVLNGVGSILGLLIPILGVFAGYLTYGKDKTTGVLESVLKRPVTRGGLITSRFLANSVSIVSSVVVSIIIGDLVILHYFHMNLTLYFSLYFIWTYVVEGLAFLALVYMFTHIVKSQGSLLGISITLFVLMGLFWQVIPTVIFLALGIGAQSSSYIPLSLGFDFGSPSGYSRLVTFLFTNRTGTITPVSANPVTYGITNFTLVLAGALWILVPFAIALFLARRSD